MFKKKNVNMKNYSHLLEQENVTLKRKIIQLENERDRAIAEKEGAIGILNKYKSEYESLIADAKTLAEKQKRSRDMIDQIIEKYKDEIDLLVKDVCEKLDGDDV